jgi:hypothetical protein
MTKPPLRHVTIPEFLRTAQTGSVDVPPPVHSTTAARLFDILSAGRIKATQCDVFKNERLTYLFIGRPSFKKSGTGEAPHWMLPVVFVIKSLTGLPIRRIHPLDTGAYASRRLPDYVTAFDLEGFELSSEPAEIGRAIAAFYETTERYLKGESRPLDSIKTEMQIGVRHARVEALVRLFAERSLPEIDDRGRNIEVQVSDDILIPNNLLGVVMPDPYQYDPGVVRYFKEMHIRTEYYGIYPLNADAHFGALYDAVARIFRGSRR